jgi:RNA polymerase sigma-70 factor (ECF subfamily)
MDLRASDEELIAGFVKGDSDALAELAHRHERALLGLARGLLGSSAAARDAVQEAWIRVIRHGASFNGRSAFKTWLYRITINRCRAVGAKERKAAGKVGAAPAFTEPPDAKVVRSERRDDLTAALSALAPPKREVILLCYHDGMTHQRAAEILEIPIGTLKSRLHAALRELRGRLEQPA